MIPCIPAGKGKGNDMFDSFGEFDSAKEINELAQNLFNEGDMDSIRALARENGVDGGIAEMYIDGTLQELADVEEAAIGKLEIEEKDLKPRDIMVDWVQYIKTSCMEDSEMARQVRKKGRSLKGCIGALLKWAFAHQQDIDGDILKAAGVRASKVTLGMPGRAEAKKIIRAYYEGKELPAEGSGKTKGKGKAGGRK